jgi:hypothetical protein
MRHFEVRLSRPVEHEYTSVQGEKKRHTSMDNEELHIACETAQRAIELALEAFPDAVIHVVQAKARAHLIVDGKGALVVDKKGQQ